MENMAGGRFTDFTEETIPYDSSAPLRQLLCIQKLEWFCEYETITVLKKITIRTLGKGKT